MTKKRPPAKPTASKTLPHTLVMELPMSFESPESSLVKGATYDPKAKELHVTLLHRTYIYTGVGEKAWEDFLRAESKGNHFNVYIRPYFKVRL